MRARLDGQLILPGRPASTDGLALRSDPRERRGAILSYGSAPTAMPILCLYTSPVLRAH